MTSFHSCRTSSTSMQQCAQCSRSAATSSAQRIVSAVELELPWLPLLAATFCATAAAPAKPRRAVRNRHTVEQQRSLHGVSTPTASTSVSLFVPSPFSGSHDRPTPSTSKKHQQHHARHSSQRGITTSARTHRETSTHSRTSINIPEAASSSNSTSNKPVNSDPYVKSFERPSGSPSSSSSDCQITQSSDTPSSRPKSSAPSSASNPLSAGHLQYLNEDVVQSTSEGKKQAKDEINTLLSYPTLYDPIRKPRHPIVLCHGLYGFDTWGLELLPALK